jgi:HlyD family secretion protein
MSAIGNQAPLPVQEQGKTAPPSPAPGEHKSNRWKWLILLMIIGGSIAAYELWIKPRRAQEQAAKTAVSYRTAKIVRGGIMRTLRVSGQTSARNYANVIAPLLRGPDSGRALTLQKLAKSGSHVKAGDLLAQIDGQAAIDHIDDVKDMVKQANNDVEKRKAEQAVEWENLMQTVRSTKADFEKWKLENGASETRTTVDQEVIKLQMEEAEARYKQYQNDLVSKKAAHAAEIRILGITLERQNRHLGRHVYDLDKFTIKSPIDGLVVMQSIFRGSEMGQVQEGDQVSPGQAFMKVVNPASMQVEASINQAEIGDFKIGLPATIGLDAFPGLTFRGKIYSIGALAVGGWRQNFFIRNVPVRVTIDSADDRLIPDLSAFAEVMAEKDDNALLAPVGAIREKGGKTYVSVKTANGFEDREVELGIVNNTHASIVSGLKEGDEVRLD